MNSCTIILFGATGDLAARKIVPAIHDLVRFEKKKIRLIGVSYDKTTAQGMLDLARNYVCDRDDAVWQEMSESVQYVCGDFSEASTYQEIKKLLVSDDDDRLLYLATGSDFFVPITTFAVNHGLINRQETDEATWHRIAYEKPFGHDAQSARTIEAAIRAELTEAQVHRVDHFLAKKALVVFPAARMIDDTFNDLWNNGNIESIQVIMNENGGIGFRGGFYDKVGALRDMVQNHVLQAISLLLIDNPVLDYPDLCLEKKKVLSCMSITDTVLGQYEGYSASEHVAKDSTTETFAAVRVGVDIPRWNEVSIFAKTGKMLATQKLVIYVLIKSNDPSRVADMPMAAIAFSDNSVALVIGEKEIAEALCAAQGPEKASQDCLDAYGRVLEFVLQGDKTLFVSAEEITEMWRIVDAVAAQKLPLYSYAQGSDGPKELEDFCTRHKMKWII